MNHKVGPFELDKVTQGNCLELVTELPDESIDVLVTSPPYWGQRVSTGNGMEEDPRKYLKSLEHIFVAFLPKLKDTGIIWINLGDAYNTPVNWRADDRKYSSLGADQAGLDQNNSAYIKPRARRKAFTSNDTPWLQYGNLLALTYRLVINLSEKGYLFRGEVIWRKKTLCRKVGAAAPIANMSLYICSLRTKDICLEAV